MIRLLPSTLLKNALKATLPIVAFGLCTISVQAQTGYKYRTKQSGSWNTLSTWQRASVSNPTVYNDVVSPEPAPNRNAEEIEILDGHTVLYDAGTNIDQLYVRPGGTFELPAGKTLSFYVAPGKDRMVVQGTQGKAGVFKNLGGTILFTDGSVSVSSNLAFEAYGTYKHAYSSNYGYIPAATWDVNSTIEFMMDGTINGGGSSIGDFITRGYSQQFGNVKWNTMTNGGRMDLLGSLKYINGNFEILSTGTGSSTSSATPLVLSKDGNFTLNIGKSLSISGTNTDVVFSPQSPTGTGTLQMNIGGGLNMVTGAGFRNNTVGSNLKIIFTGTGDLFYATSMANMDFEIAPVSVITLASDLTSNTAGTAFVVKGSLKTSSFALKGSNNFDLQSGGTLQIGSASGISASGTAGSIQITGTRTFSALASYVYNGASAQVTGTGLPASINELTLSNPAGLTLSAPVTVTNTLKMAEGVLNPSATNKITIGATGTVLMPSADKVSYVNGALGQMIASTATKTLEFPLGKNGKYRPVTLEITQANNTATTYTAEQFEGVYPTARTLPASLNRVSLVRYFRINQSPAATLNEGLVTLSYGADDAVTDPGMLSIAKSSGANGWMDLDGTAPFGATASAGSIVGFFTDFSDFVLANKSGGSNPLPVELVSFSAKNQENKVVLDWATASEKNNARFEVERSSNGVDFYRIAQVEGAGTTSIAQNYRNTDMAPLAGLAYYRLKQVDFNGTFEYSKIVTVTSQSGKNPVVLYPNPTAGNVTLTAGKGAAQIRILNVLGQQVYQATVKDATSANFDLNHLPSGTYQLVVEKDDEKTVRKFMKTNR